MSDREPLPPDLAALFERESHAYEEDVAMKARVLSRVELAVGLGLPPHGGGGAPPPAGGGTGHGGHGAAAAAGAGKIAGAFGVKAIAAATVSAFIAGGAVGGAVVQSTAPRTPSAMVSAPPAPSLAATTAPALENPTAPDAPEPPASAPSARAATASAPPPPPLKAEVHGDLTRERELLDAARAAMARGSAEDAIAAAERHARRWPHGYLAEEREAVLVQALALAGRRDEAQRRADAFRKAYPQSMLLPTIDSALAAPPP